MSTETTYTKDQITFMLGAFIGTLQKKGIIEITGDVSKIHEARQEFWEEFKDISEIANDI